MPAMRDYEPTTAARDVEEFIDAHLSNWYVRLCRRRFWKGECSKTNSPPTRPFHLSGKHSRHDGPLAPFSPTGCLKPQRRYQKSGAASVHLFDFPAAADATAIDNDLLERMDYAAHLLSSWASTRKNIRVKQPLSRILLPVLNPSFKRPGGGRARSHPRRGQHQGDQYITDTEGCDPQKAKPTFKTLGRKLGKDMKAAGDLIAALDQKQIADIERSGSYTLVIGDNNYDLVLKIFGITSKTSPAGPLPLIKASP